MVLFTCSKSDKLNVNFLIVLNALKLILSILLLKSGGNMYWEGIHHQSERHLKYFEQLSISCRFIAIVYHNISLFFSTVTFIWSYLFQVMFDQSDACGPFEGFSTSFKYMLGVYLVHGQVTKPARKVGFTFDKNM